jgi:hypothetical protein
VWRRFAEAPHTYPNVPELLQRARPQRPRSLFDYSESWPQENEEAETSLRERLSALRGALPQQARTEIAALENEHAPRRSWVWATLGRSPLAAALEHLAALAQSTARPLVGATAHNLAATYADWG